MNNFTLNDIDDLVISGRTRLDATDEYDISFYESYIKENINIIVELIKNVQNYIELIKDDITKNRVLHWSQCLFEVLDKHLNRQPRIEYENSPYSVSTGTGYLQTHKYAEFIQNDFQHFVIGYSKIINFMNNIYKNATISEEKGEIDSNILYSIFYATKKACSDLGIHCPNASFLYESITDDPYAEKNDLLDMEVEIVEDDSLEDDIILTSLPYTVTVPMFTWQGSDKYEMPVTNPKPKIKFNKSYLQKYPIK